MDAVLLCAGQGTRLRPLTAVVPKPALPLLDVPLGAWALHGLVAAGLSVVVNLSHLGDLVTEALRPFGAFETMVEGPAAYGSGGTVAALRPRVGARLVTWNCDALIEMDPAALVATHLNAGAEATVAVVPVDGGGDFELTNGTASAFIDRRERPGAPGGRFTGAAVFERRTLDLVPDRRPLGLAEHLLKLLANSGRLAAHVHEGYYLDAGTFAGYLEASADVLAGVAPASPRPPPGDIVALEDGRAYVGPGAEVELESLGPGAIVLRGARVRRRATVERAIVWPTEVVPPGTHLRACVWAFGRPHGNARASL
jgi:mannose-1-phosphate guanylyltransferase